MTQVNEFYPAQPNEFAQGAPEAKIPNQMDPRYRDIGRRTKIGKRRVNIHSTNTKGPRKYYTFRAFMTKEDTTSANGNTKFLASLLVTEATDITALPEQVVDELKKLVKKGASDLQQDWANALELVHKAYQVANVRRPAPDQKGAWKQYEGLIEDAVHALRKTRGVSGKWRMTTTKLREQVQLDPNEKSIGKRRFFVDIPNVGSTEVDAKNIDEIIEQMSNKFRRHGAKARVEERAKKHAIISVWVNDVKRDNLTIKEIS